MEPVYVVHYHDYAARLQGTQIAYDVGVQRMCWQVQSLTNRMGDAGTLKHIHGQSAPWGPTGADRTSCRARLPSCFRAGHERCDMGKIIVVGVD